MRRIAGLASLLLFAFGASPQQQPENPLVTELLASIKGKETRKASEVFKNVKVLGDVPAAKFLRMMDAGYNRALGVGCEHCHVEDQWEVDDKRPKRAAREMIVFMKDLNARLAEMPEIDNSDATVNCTTCHRGYVKPALQMR
jgi:hypothetical protein